MLKRGESYVYSRTFRVESGFNRGRIILHFGAVDQIARVKINGMFVGENIGGYLPFSIDISEYAHEGDNTVELEAVDTLDKTLPYGKQRKKRGGMWYTEISGIWQAVWLESVPREYIRSLMMTPSTTSVKIKTEGGAKRKTIILQSGERFEYEGDEAEITPPETRLWTPDDPYLYNFTLECGEDKIESYFALRAVDIRKINGVSRICLNGEPVFFHGLLDQGYYSDGIYLPATPKGYEYDILKMKECGFNMLRKHIKIEPELFYYYCDKYGMLVFQDMVNSGPYSFIIDTALPTIGVKRGISHRVTRARREFFEKHSRDTIAHLYNHPSVVYYTIFNEGWGQYDADRLYLELKALDGSRIYDTASGWFKPRLSDVESEHIYFKKIKLRPSDKPIILSEFGGYSCKDEEHSYNPYKTYGYKFFTSPEKFAEAMVSLYENEVLPHIKTGLCGAVLTQVSDVEDETNGLLTYDRQVMKISPEKMKDISEKLYSEFEKCTRE